MIKCQKCGREIVGENVHFCDICGTAVTDVQEIKAPKLPVKQNRIIAAWPEWSVEQQLGRGSYGTVYKAVRKDNNVESFSAIKVISIPSDPSEIASLRSEGLDINGTKTYLKGIVDDFVGEIRLMESLKGVQNIVSVEDYKVVEKSDEIGWDIYIRMELLVPFSAYLCDRQLSEEEVIKFGIDICSALEICAKRNIIHRDIKPENIFINDFGHFKLGDFGIARKLENATGGLSQKGTLNYMAPEIAIGNEYDERADIYSLGIVLYKLLNGNRLPFIETDAQLLNPNERRAAVERRVKGEALPSPKNASEELSNVILRACAHNPKNRFASATELKRALTAVENGVYVIVPVLSDSFSDGEKSEADFKGINSEETFALPDTHTLDDRFENAEEPEKKEEPSEEFETNPSVPINTETKTDSRKTKKKTKPIVVILTIAAILCVLTIMFLGCLGLFPMVFSNRGNDESRHSSKIPFGSSSETQDVSDFDSSTETFSVGDELSVTPEHVHVFSKNWTNDETAHWNSCECGGMDNIGLHSFGNWSVTKPSTETETGLKERQCSVCSYKEVAEEPVKSHVHAFSNDWSKNETAHWRVCSCGEKGQLDSHEYSSWNVTKKATCTANGSQKRSCTVCKHTQTEAIYAEGHKIIIDAAVAPTCTKNGLTEGKHCSVCGVIAVEQKVVAKLSHVYKNGKCSSCGGAYEKAYSLSWNDGGSYGYTVTVKRTDSPNAGASIGSLGKNSTVYYGDVLVVSYSANTGYSISSYGYSSITVTGNVTSSYIYATANANSYTYNVVYKSSNGSSLGSTTVTNKFGTTATVSPKTLPGYVTPPPQTVIWDTTSAKTITFVYTPGSVSTSQNIANGTWWYNETYGGITYSVNVEYRNRTANSVQIRVVWTNTLKKSCYYGYAQTYNATIGGVGTGKVQIASASLWAGSWVNYDRYATGTSSWITVPVAATQNQVTVSASYVGGSNSGSWTKTMYIPTY